MHNPSDVAKETVEAIMQANAEKGDTWKRQSILVHLQHAVCHIVDYMDETTQNEEDHLQHALTRCAMALTVREERGKD